MFDRLRRGQPGLKAFLASGQTDFRCPEHLNLWLKNDTRDFPMLTAFVKKRFEKRESIQGLENLMEWIRGHGDSEVRSALLEAPGADAETVVFAIPYALKKSGKTVANAKEADMRAALRDYRVGLLRRS